MAWFDKSGVQLINSWRMLEVQLDFTRCCEKTPQNRSVWHWRISVCDALCLSSMLPFPLTMTLWPGFKGWEPNGPGHVHRFEEFQTPHGSKNPLHDSTRFHVFVAYFWKFGVLDHTNYVAFGSSGAGRASCSGSSKGSSTWCNGRNTPRGRSARLPGGKKYESIWNDEMLMLFLHVFPLWNVFHLVMFGFELPWSFFSHPLSTRAFLAIFAVQDDEPCVKPKVHQFGKGNRKDDDWCWWFQSATCIYLYKMRVLWTADQVHFIKMLLSLSLCVRNGPFGSAPRIWII